MQNITATARCIIYTIPRIPKTPRLYSLQLLLDIHIHHQWRPRNLTLQQSLYLSMGLALVIIEIHILLTGKDGAGGQSEALVSRVGVVWYSVRGENVGSVVLGGVSFLVGGLSDG